MKIENIELFYLSMPEILDEADGSQDALIVKSRRWWFYWLGRM